MASALLPSSPPAPAKFAGQFLFKVSDNIWRGPLVPVALCFTGGIVLDRFTVVPILLSLAAALSFLIAWLVASQSGKNRLAVVYLNAVVFALGAAYHHRWLHLFAADDIGETVTEDPQPIKLRGIIVEEPTSAPAPAKSPLQSFAQFEKTRSVIDVRQIHAFKAWRRATGLARLVVVGKLNDIHVGDEVEVVGRWSQPPPPANPGEFDYASYLRDQRIRAVVRVRGTSESVLLLGQGDWWSVSRMMPMIRGWGQRTLQDAMSDKESIVGAALLLGESSQMTGPEWDKYIQTGVIHVLAISGQHLVILAGFLWLLVRVLGIRRRRIAWFIFLFLLSYGLLTGGRPPIMRSVVMVGTFCVGLLLRQRVLPANSFALAWIVVAILNPTDIFTAGCQLSFLCVAVMYWGTGLTATITEWASFSWLRPNQTDPLENLIDEARPTWRKIFRGILRMILASYALTFALWLATTPLVASRYHIISFAGLVIGPPVIFLTTLALLTGFILLFMSILCWPLAVALGWITSQFLAICEWLVSWSASWPWAYRYVGDIPSWWLRVFYLGLLATLLLIEFKRRWRWSILAGMGWLCLGLLIGSTSFRGDEVRITFLAVGHGGCIVVETLDGRTILYDTGSMNGSEVTERQISPYLWSRGIRRIDEVFLSHADLDHFNGLVSLLDRFEVGQVTCTPTFEQKRNDAVRITLKTLRKRGIPIRTIKTGDKLQAGETKFQVLHPPAAGPDGTENVRSMVLVLRHQGTTLMLTGDLEGEGMEQVLKQSLPKVDILMAPHHGSRRSNTPELARRVKPRLIVACQGPPRGATRPPDANRFGGIPYWGTWPEGAIIIRGGRSRLTVESFVTKQRLVIMTGKAKTEE